MANTLRVGAGRIDITPPPGTQIAGSVGLRRSGKSVLDPLFARAIVFESGGKKICLLVIDVTILTLEITQAVREGVKDLGFHPDAVMVQATQTHTAPGLGHFVLDKDLTGVGPDADFIRGADSNYDRIVVPRLIEAIRAANASLAPAQMGIGSAYEPRLAFNRRGITKEGATVMPWNAGNEPLGPTSIKYMEGPIDPEVGVLALKRDDGSFASIVTHYTCHPVCVYWHPTGSTPAEVISADWPGVICSELEKSFGTGCVPLVVNGACGDVNPWPSFDPDVRPDHHRIGKALAGWSKKVLETMSFAGDVPIDFAVKHVKLPVREPEPQKLKDAKAFLQQHPTPKWIDSDKKMSVEWQWMHAAGVVSVDLLRRREPMFDYEIQVLRIGDLAIVGLPGEPFAIGGVRVKMACPAKQTMIAHMTTQYVGYLATKEAFPHGGHEVNTSYWAKFAPEALDIAVEGASELTKQVFA